MTYLYRCTNADCAELDVDKESPIEWDEPVLCGTCGEPTELLTASTKPAERE